MKDLGIKATIYDIFGYLIPGIILLGLGFISYEHSKGVFNVYPVFQSFIENIDVKLLVFLLLLAYFLGHGTSTLSSFLIEKNIIFKSYNLSKNLKPEYILSTGLLDRFNNKYEQTFGHAFEAKDFRAIICYVEEYRPAVYSTAFVFLSFYGMARNIAFISSIMLLWELFNLIKFANISISIYAIIYLISLVVFCYEYYRFFKYFKEQILMGFIIPDPYCQSTN